MSKFVVNEAEAVTRTLDGSGDLLLVTRNGSIGVGGDGSIALVEDAGSRDNTIKIYGQIVALPGQGLNTSTAIRISGDNTHLILGDSAFVTGGQALYADGANARIENHGELIGQGYARACVTLGMGTLINSGRIYGDYAVTLYGASTLINQADGEIFASSLGVLLNSGVGGMSTRTVNHGSIIGLGGARGIDGGVGKDTVINDGYIRGSVYLYAGNDVIDNRGGKINGGIYGADGGDTLITDKSSDKLIETAFDIGMDTVKSTASYVLTDNVEQLMLLGARNINGTGTDTTNLIAGNKGDNILKGLGGDDLLNGGAGRDILIGGGGADHFQFQKGNGIDTIRDFANMSDIIDVSGFARVTSFAALKPLIEVHGQDVWVDFGRGDRLILQNTGRNEIDAGDFVFAF
ncbi:hypothetical protein JJB09_03250 [Rhizobium sp. KVB221]|uniref:Calcium-binding protein n=1 Tax=Rhizobium setariae TaxID=2801340 RepID=A0A937CMK4_9HYPH|nr:calcium-binding protein [Rhizobium setariae]MBL0371034.1 hypothetical protein [Rhizobium setariae]